MFSHGIQQIDRFGSTETRHQPSKFNRLRHGTRRLIGNLVQTPLSLAISAGKSERSVLHLWKHQKYNKTLPANARSRVMIISYIDDFQKNMLTSFRL